MLKDSGDKEPAELALGWVLIQLRSAPCCRGGLNPKQPSKSGPDAGSEHEQSLHLTISAQIYLVLQLGPASWGDNILRC